MFARASSNRRHVGARVVRAAVVAAASVACVAPPTFADAGDGQSVRPHAGMLRYPDVSKDSIVFVYANSIWTAPRDGGPASPVASPPGRVAFPKFSPDGQSIAFMSNYDGNLDLYTIPVTGGEPFRVTHHPSTEVFCDWGPETGDAARLLFYTNGFAGRDRIVQMFEVPAKGGLPKQLPVPYGADGGISADGKWLAYVPNTIDSRTWKRYRGGMASDVWLFNLKDHTSKQMTDWEGIDTLPMWQGSKVYYLSDNGPEHKLNIWVYDTTNGRRAQVTTFKEFDVKWPSIGPGPRGAGEIVFQYGPDLYLLDLGSNAMRSVNVTIPGARPTLRAEAVDVSKQITSGSISPSGKRAALVARGDVWTAPAKEGSPRNLTRTSGVAERDASWSPDGRWIAYFSDATGEYELYMTQSDGRGETKQLTHDGTCFRYNPVWSPDSKKIAFTDKTGAIFLLDVGTGESKEIDRDPWDAGPPSMTWSHDSRWLAYDHPGEESNNNAVWLYNVEKGELSRVTAPMFSSGDPAFDRKGDFLYFATSRAFDPMYGDLDTSFIYPETQVVLAAPLRKDVKAPLLPKSDEEAWDKDKKDGEKDKADKKDDAKEDDKPAADEKKEGEKKPAAVKDDGVSGTWTGNITGGPPLPPGGLPFTLVISLEADNTASGSFTVAIGAGSFSGGSYEPATGDLTFKIAFGGGPTVTFTARITGKSITGKATDAQSGVTAEFTGERTALAAAGEAKGDKAKAEKPVEKVEIDVEGLEARAILLPIKRGVFRSLAVNDKNQLIFVRRSARGDDDPPAIKLFDIKDEKKDEKTVAAGAGSFDISADGKKLLVFRGGAASIQDASAGATADSVVTAGMSAIIDPREEWKQVYTDAWRIERDYFYDPNMHGVDWKGMRDRYALMLADCASRQDVSYVISELISELNVGHAYYRPSRDEDDGPKVAVGMLGCDYTLENGAYRISKIYEGARWDADARGPLSQPGIDVKVGDYLLAVNGVPVDTSKDPWAAFQGVTGRSVTITVSEEPTMSDKARVVAVEPASSEGALRYRDWIEQKRAYVDYKSGGKLGYIYVPSTGIDGQDDLVRQFYGQRDKPGLIIDERWNSGGQIPTRFVELLNRPVTNYWARRDGKDWTWPPDAHNGPQTMLINGLSGSGGDAFPFYFRQAGLGKLIGTRTWGGLVGISGNPGLIDGAGVTVPTFGFYEKDGTWGIEGHGVDPDIVVIDDPALMVDGGDPQLDAAIEYTMGQVQTKPYTPPKRPAYPNRSGMGVRPEDK